jgi:hypothetical protein
MMGMSPEIFWEMTLREATIAINGYHLQQYRASRVQWEIMRYQTAWFMAPHKKLRPLDILSFPDEISEMGGHVELTPEQIEEKLAIMDQATIRIPINSLTDEFRIT